MDMAERREEIQKLAAQVEYLGTPGHKSAQQGFDFLCKLVRICQLSIEALDERIGNLERDAHIHASRGEPLPDSGTGGAGA